MNKKELEMRWKFWTKEKKEIAISTGERFHLYSADYLIFISNHHRQISVIIIDAISSDSRVSVPSNVLHALSKCFVSTIDKKKKRKHL